MVKRPALFVVVLCFVFWFVTVAFATGELSLADRTVPETVFSCAKEEKERTSRGTISNNRLIFCISRSLKNEGKEKSRLKRMISGNLPHKKTQFRQNQKNTGNAASFQYVEIRREYVIQKPFAPGIFQT